ncbi:MAG: hypothetical protein ACOYS2_01790 [Patescibacteria group bacterium]
MKIEIQNIKDNPANALRRAGYVFQYKEGEEMSFVRPFSQSGFPRFHIYARMSGLNLEISIHLDQKKETYGKDTRHHGEYENEGAVKEEVERLKKILS